jgi:hypothetical protein
MLTKGLGLMKMITPIWDGQPLSGSETRGERLIFLGGLLKTFFQARHELFQPALPDQQIYGESNIGYGS